MLHVRGRASLSTIFIDLILNVIKVKEGVGAEVFGRNGSVIDKKRNIKHG